MEVLRETGPLILGLLVIPPIARALTGTSSDDVRTLVTFLLSIVIGFLWSTFVGEQGSPDLEERLIALVIDTSLAFTGATLAAWAVWSRVLKAGASRN